MNSSSSSVRLAVVARSNPYMRPTKSRYSGPVRRSSKPIPSGTTPICRFTSTACLAKSKPKSCMPPDVGANSPVSILMVVDLPAPLGPKKPKNCPAPTVRSTDSTAVSAPKRRVNFSVTIAASLKRSPQEFVQEGNQRSDRSLLRTRHNSYLLRLFCGKRRENRRQFHSEHGSALLPVVAKDPSPVLLHDSKANAQAQPRAFADRLGRVKGIKNALGVLDTGSSVRE